MRSVIALQSSISPYLLKTKVRVSAVLSHLRPWMKILRWAASTSASSRKISITSGCLLTPFLIKATRWSFVNDSRSFFTSSSSSSLVTGFVFVAFVFDWQGRSVARFVFGFFFLLEINLCLCLVDKKGKENARKSGQCSYV